MKKIILVVIILELGIISTPFTLKNNVVMAANGNTSNNTNEIINAQEDNLKIGDFINEAQKYTKESMPDIDLNNLLSTAISGKIDNSIFLKIFWKLLGNEFVTSIKTLTSIIVVVVIHSILKAISDGLSNKGVSQVTYYVEYIIIVTIIMSNFAEVITMVKSSVKSLIAFINLLIPILTTLMMATGGVTSASLLEPLIIFMTTFVGNFIVNIILPIVLASTALGIISQISDKVQVNNLSKLMKTSCVWVLAIILTLFVGITSLESTLSSSVDGVSAKTAKAAVSNFIPVVGKILGDAVDTVMGCSIILKNAIGIVGVIVIISICLVPILKLTVLMAMYYLTSAVCQPVADAKIINLFKHMGETFKILLAILCSISAMLIIGVTIIIKMSNSGIMMV